MCPGVQWTAAWAFTHCEFVGPTELGSKDEVGYDGHNYGGIETKLSVEEKFEGRTRTDGTNESFADCWRHFQSGGIRWRWLSKSAHPG